MAINLSDLMERELTRLLLHPRPLSSVDGRTVRALKKRRMIEIKRKTKIVKTTARGRAFGLALRV